MKASFSIDTLNLAAYSASRRKRPAKRGVSHIIVFKKALFSGLFFLGLVGCSYENENTETTLSGSWVEVVSKKDTLTFEPIDADPFFYLIRGTELQGGVVLPKSRSGMYTYTLKYQEIGLKWLLSSNSEWEWYYFKVNGPILQIGNFYNSENGTILKFRKLK